MAGVRQEAVGGLLPARSGSAASAAEETILAEQVEQFQSRGFTVLRGVLSAAEVAAARARLDVRMAAKLAAQLGELEGKPATGEKLAAAGGSISIGGPADSASIGFPGLLAAAPEVAELLIKPFLLNPRLLDLAERVMGPFVQGDGFYVVGTPPAQLTGQATGVDRSCWPRPQAGTATRTTITTCGATTPAMPATWRTGGSRSRRRSQRTCSATCRTWTAQGGRCSQSQARTAPRSATSRPAPRRRRRWWWWTPKRATQCSSTATCCTPARPTADYAWRYMVTSFVVRAGLPHRDDFTASPLVRALVAEAEACGDRRVLRFFAADAADGGPLRREEKQWRAAVEEERRLLRPAL